SPHTPSTRPWAHPPPTSRSPSTTEPRSSPRRALTTTDASPTSGPTTSTRATTGSCSAPAPTSQPVRWTISIPRSPSTSRSRPGRSTITSRCCSVRSPTAPTAPAEPPIDTRGSRPPARSDPQQTAEAGPNPNPSAHTDRMVPATAPRDSQRHEIRDLNVTSQLWGDFETAHTEGNNEHIVATDTQKNTVFAKAKELGVSSPEQFLLGLADHFTSSFDWVTGGRWEAEEYGWDRINDHHLSFFKSAPEVRTAVLTRDGDKDTLSSGFNRLTVLKTTESGFVGYPKDKYTTLPETD